MAREPRHAAGDSAAGRRRAIDVGRSLDQAALRPARQSRADAAARRRSKGTVYLAETTSDLREQRETLRRDLQQHGYTVLPDRPLPHVADEAAAVIRQMLRTLPHVDPPDRPELQPRARRRRAVARRNAERAGDRAREQDGASPPDVDSARRSQVNDERQQQVLIEAGPDRSAHGGRRRPARNARSRICGRHSARPGSNASRNAARHARRSGHAPARSPQCLPDGRPARRRRDHAVGRRPVRAAIEVIQPVFEGDEAEIREYHEENLRTCDGVLIFYGAGQRAVAAAQAARAAEERRLRPHQAASRRWRSASSGRGRRRRSGSARTRPS